MAQVIQQEVSAEEFYDAFISYVSRGADAEIASALQRDLESFRVPRKLVEAGYPASLRPVFRDVSDLAAASSLRNSLKRELRRSRFLIVLCSPRAQRSEWVNEEIRQFLALGREDRVLAVLLEGEPADSFPPALEIVRDSLLSVDAASDGPLAADLRPKGRLSKRQQQRTAVLRLAAAILGCNYDDLVRRAEERSARFRRRIAASVAIVLMVFVVLALLFEKRSVRAASADMAIDRIDEETTLLARSISAALEQSDPVMDRLSSLARDHDPLKAYDRVAHSLRDLMQGRPGVSSISISFPDGTFQGAYRDEDGSIRFQDSRVSARDSIIKRYTLVGHERISPYYEEHIAFDPRGREYYKLAVSGGHRMWTKPFPFFKTHYTGIARAEPVYESDSKTLHAVITLDFDVTALSVVLSRASMDGAATLLYADDGTVLAYPAGEGRINNLPLRQDRALLYSDLDDPRLNAFFSEFVGKPDTLAVHEIAVEGEKQLVVAKPLAAGDDLGWFVATIIPEARLLR